MPCGDGQERKAQREQAACLGHTAVDDKGETSLALWILSLHVPLHRTASWNFYGLLLLTVLQENDHFFHFTDKHIFEAKSA